MFEAEKETGANEALQPLTPKAHVVPRRGLPHLNAKLAGAGPVTVAFLGGSITEGAGASAADTTSWRALTGRYLQAAVGNRPLRCINAGVGGTDSTLGAHRLFAHALSEGPVDLLFVEFSVNDGDNREESLKGMEGIVRGCRRLSPETDICFLYTGAEKNLTGLKPFNIAVHEEVADYYGIPSVDFAAGVYDGLQFGEYVWAELAPDGYHPNDAGHALYARFLREYLEQALDFVSGGSAGEEISPNPMPEPSAAVSEESVAVPEKSMAVSKESVTMLKESATSSKKFIASSQESKAISEEGTIVPEHPLIAGNYEFGAMPDFKTASYSPAFRFSELSPDEPLMNWRYSLEYAETNEPGASFTFEAEGQGAGLLLLCGPDTGIFEYSVNGGPFTSVNLFDDWCLGAYRPVPALFSGGGNGRRLSIAVRNTDQKDPRSTGTGLKVLKLLSS